MNGPFRTDEAEMKRFAIWVLGLVAAVSLNSAAFAQAQWNYSFDASGNAQAVYPGGILCKGATGGSQGPNTLNCGALYINGAAVSAGAGTPGGTSGQVQYNNAGAFGGFTMAGDCTLAQPNITCTKTSGVGFGTFATANAATPPAIGGTTPAAGSFTAVVGTTGTFSGQLQGLGTNTNDSATTGQIGEFISATVLTGSAVNLPIAGTAENITSISLTAGDWEVSGTVCYNQSGVSANGSYGWISAASATLPTAPNAGAYFQGLLINSVGCIPIGVMRQSLASTTTVYLSAAETSSGGSVTAFGFIRARRMR